LSEKEGVDARVNRFLIQGEGNIKYTYNNGLIAKDEKLAAMNFLNALEKLPNYIEQEKKKIAELKKDLPILQEVINGTWSKENRLSDLKTELAAVERKIQLSISPEPIEESMEQVEKQQSISNNSETIIRTNGIHLPRGVS
jgi:small-conductance mechanosensitive channel